MQMILMGTWKAVGVALGVAFVALSALQIAG
jgi:hypothetical protein